jgi:ribose-phosphate pyrophosphokinase
VREIVVLSGSAHRPLAQQICDHLGVSLSPVEIRRFSNDCLYVQIQENCRQRDVYVIQPLVAPTQEHLMELLLMLDAARGASAAEVTAVIPHYAYARSDKKDASRISIAGRLVDHFRDHDLDNTVVVSPDLGNAKTATQFARLLGLPVAAGSKQRLADDRVVIDAIVGDVRGKRAIILDDEIATGGSILELLDKLAEQHCPSAAVACTHGLFAGKAMKRLHDHPLVTEIVTTDTVPPPKDEWPLLTVRSVAKLFAEAISRIHGGESISSLFDGVDPTHGPPQPQLPFHV